MSARFALRIVLEDGDVAEDITEAEPMELDDDGFASLHPFLGRLLQPLAVGDSIDVTLSPEDAFGVPSAQLCHSIPRMEFAQHLEIAKGVAVEFDWDGEILIGSVVGIAEDDVVVDFNHPLTGHTIRLVAHRLNDQASRPNPIN